MNNIDFIPQEICQIHRFHRYLVQVDVLFMRKNLYKKHNFNKKLLNKLF